MQNDRRSKVLSEMSYRNANKGQPRKDGERSVVDGGSAPKRVSEDPADMLKDAKIIASPRLEKDGWKELSVTKITRPDDRGELGAMIGDMLNSLGGMAIGSESSGEEREPKSKNPARMHGLFR